MNSMLSLCVKAGGDQGVAAGLAVWDQISSGKLGKVMCVTFVRVRCSELCCCECVRARARVSVCVCCACVCLSLSLALIPLCLYSLSLTLSVPPPPLPPQDVSPDERSVACALALHAKQRPPTAEGAESILGHVLDGKFPNAFVSTHVVTSMLSVYARAEPVKIPQARYLWDRTVAGEFGGGSAPNLQTANTMVSLYAKARDVPAAQEFWRDLMSGKFGESVALPTTRSITSMLRLFAATGCPFDWARAMMEWFSGPHADAAQLTPDARVLQAALLCCKRHRANAEAAAWVTACVARGGQGVIDVHVRKALGQVLGQEGAEALLASLLPAKKGKGKGPKPPSPTSSPTGAGPKPTTAKHAAPKPSAAVDAGPRPRATGDARDKPSATTGAAPQSRSAASDAASNPSQAAASPTPSANRPRSATGSRADASPRPGATSDSPLKPRAPRRAAPKPRTDATPSEPTATA